MQNVKVGAHVSIAGGLDTAFERVKRIGGNCMQIFSSSPRSWTLPDISEESCAKFISEKNVSGIGPVYFHASYLINLAANGYVGELSKKALVKDLEIAESLGMNGVIVHTGSFKNGTKDAPYQFETIEEIQYQKLIEAIQGVLEISPDTSLMLENAGTRKIGWSMNELFTLIKHVNDHRLKICLDTCHLHAAGYDLSTEEKYQDFFDHFDKEIGLEKLELIHLNDSKDSVGSFRDRHENILQGQIPKKVFDNLFTFSQTKNLPFILEVPGFDKKGPDDKNIQIVKEIVSRNEK